MMARWFPTLLTTYQGLSTNTQVGLLWGVRALIAVGLVTLTMESVFDLQDEQRRYQHASETLQWMQANAEVLANKKINLPSAPKPLEKSLLAIASETAGPLGLEFQSVQPNGDESIQLQLQAVLFADALAWFRVLHNTEGLVVGQITLGKHENPSHVDVSIQLQDVARSNLSNDANSVRSSTLVVNRKN